MKKNEGMSDRIIRATLALSALFLFYNKIVTGTAGIALFIISGVLALTSLIGVCPIYSIFRISTFHHDNAAPEMHHPN